MNLLKQLSGYVDTYNKGYTSTLPGILSVLKTGQDTLQVELLYDIFRYAQATDELVAILYDWLGERNKQIPLADVAFKSHWLELLVALIKNNGHCSQEVQTIMINNRDSLHILAAIEKNLSINWAEINKDAVSELYGIKTATILKTLFPLQYEEFKYRVLLEDKQAWSVFCDKIGSTVSDYKLPIFT